MKLKNKNVFYLGLTSLFTDMSSEMIFPLLPLFMANVLGLNKTFIGIIEGVAESTAAILKVISGYVSDRIRKRKLLVGIGYSLSTLAKPLFALVSSGTQMLGLRFVERMGKGVRDAPRDALISESVNKHVWGKSFGFQRALDRAGSVIGLIITFILLQFFALKYRTLFVLSVIPAIIAILIIVIFVKEVRTKIKEKFRFKFRLSDFNPNLKKFIIISALFNLGNFSVAFLLLRAQAVGILVAFIPLIYLVYNLTYALFSVPAGRLSDKFGRKGILLAGYLLFSISMLSFAYVQSSLVIWLLFAIYGLQIAITDNVSRAFISDMAKANQKGTAFGTYYTAIGIAVLPASIMAGLAWDKLGSQTMFIIAATIGFVSTLLLLAMIKSRTKA